MTRTTTSPQPATGAHPVTPTRRRGVAWPSAGTVRGGLLGGLATASGMALTATSGWLIVRAAERPVILTLLTAIVLVRTFGIARPVFRYAERLVSHDAALRLLAERRTDAYAALVPLTPARLGRRRRADVLTGVVDDLTDAVDAQVRVTVPVISTALAGGIVIAVVAAIALPVGLVLLALALVVAVICAVALALESRCLPDLLAARAEVSRVSELVATQARELRAVGGWPTALGWLDDAHRSLEHTTRRISAGRSTAAALFLVAVGTAVAVTAAIAKGLDVATPVKALLVLTPVAVSEAITPLVDAMRALARARGSEDRIDALLHHDPAVVDRAPVDDTEAGEVDAEPRHGAAVMTTGLTASWTGARTDLAPVDLDLRPGSRTVVTGPNGTGKSTLLAVLARHLDPSGGRYLLDGRDALTRPLEDTRSRIAVVDDEPHVFATTLRGNLTLARPDASDADLEAALRAAGLGDLLADLPDGLDTPLGASGRGLSGGERARLGIARAHVSRRPLVLLDEPVAHLDPPTARAVLADLTHASDGAQTLVMVTHRDEGTDLFDRVVTLHHPASGTMPPSTTTGDDGRGHGSGARRR
ncbi:thiol reductant ABC exporter subunit CydC [Intrasporangium sp. YIM S08009]|uniref:thiol reductant ABC exporter subunit CydC n=1 Tax=Intrasporangium zincisolvens TaxID=3080018 RepID=UPI002B052B4B|nr:thiol reductant ABC exporter subunit CydC [Intrasporangium sp. YIM S08009]